MSDVEKLNDKRTHSRSNLNTSCNSASLRSNSCKFSGKNYRNLDPSKKLVGSKRNSSQHHVFQPSASSLSLAVSAAADDDDDLDDQSLGDFGFRPQERLVNHNDDEAGFKRHTLLTKSKTEANGFVGSKLISLKELRKSFKSLIDDITIVSGPSSANQHETASISNKPTSQQPIRPSLNIKFNRLQLMGNNKLIPPNSTNLNNDRLARIRDDEYAYTNRPTIEKKSKKKADSAIEGQLFDRTFEDGDNGAIDRPPFQKESALHSASSAQSYTTSARSSCNFSIKHSESHLRPDRIDEPPPTPSPQQQQQSKRHSLRRVVNNADPIQRGDSPTTDQHARESLQSKHKSIRSQADIADFDKASTSSSSNILYNNNLLFSLSNNNNNSQKCPFDASSRATSAIRINELNDRELFETNKRSSLRHLSQSRIQEQTNKDLKRHSHHHVDVNKSSSNKPSTHSSISSIASLVSSCASNNQIASRPFVHENDDKIGYIDSISLFHSSTDCLTTSPLKKPTEQHFCSSQVIRRSPQKGTDHAGRDSPTGSDGRRADVNESLSQSKSQNFNMGQRVSRAPGADGKKPISGCIPPSTSLFDYHNLSNSSFIGKYLNNIDDEETSTVNEQQTASNGDNPSNFSLLKYSLSYPASFQLELEAKEKVIEKLRDHMQELGLAKEEEEASRAGDEADLNESHSDKTSRKHHLKQQQKRFSVASTTSSSISAFDNISNKDEFGTSTTGSIKSDDRMSFISNSSQPSTLNRQLNQTLTLAANQSKETLMRFKKSSFRQKLIRINKRWSISRFNKTTGDTEFAGCPDSDKLKNEARAKESDNYFLNELDETSIVQHHNSSSNTYSSTSSARYSIQSDSYFSKLSFANSNAGNSFLGAATGKDQTDAIDLRETTLRKRSASLNNSIKSVFQEQQQQQENTKPILSKAVVIKEFTPSPYDKNSLSLKIGDTIDVIDMNETGIWTGILNKKIGTFKFIHVNILETIQDEPDCQDISTSGNEQPVERASTTCSNRSNKTLSINSTCSAASSNRAKSKSLNSLLTAKTYLSTLHKAHSTPSFNGLSSASSLTASVSSKSPVGSANNVESANFYASNSSSSPSASSTSSSSNFSSQSLNDSASEKRLEEAGSSNEAIYSRRLGTSRPTIIATTTTTTTRN